MRPEPTTTVTVSQSQISAVLGLIYDYLHNPDFALLSTDEQELILGVDELFAQAEEDVYDQIV